ncbi:MAG: ABC transporter ATP-binding protein [Deltaproteobacteria bacterium]|nr:MAG: ABC transporter ATP-binding protein [Deltaproteobacteria bacterium]
MFVDLDIVAEDVEKFFGSVKVLNRISLKIRKGEFYTILGPNGAGKTTLIKLLATLSRATSGRVVVANHDVMKEPDKVRAKIGFVSHDPYLYGDLSALENIEFFATLYGVPKARDRAVEVISQVGLQNRMYDLVRTFSRGMQQRLAVARAIVHDPLILLLDEPYTGLDQHGIRVLGDMLRWLKSQGRTIVLTTHNLAEVFDVSDRVSILSNGKIVYEGFSREVDISRFKKIYFDSVGT